ncbi:ribose import ATP-binding protein RbsA 1 [Mesorhizobium sp. L-8-10]|uniref:sugar ABC transporter ATP-binding protein n=1 Tax=Mesorhizobium sp. L-8-10 TaxID=2744523 RepID=UPI001925D2F3|nr:sugar ABC transporter ATP-binding protein [Mesorhizobium sp. L-8-10]BCH29378.1 ribose import ATP-binding protein RbsA 1 [Mesorhizobium sp. L-8-10]
MSAPVLSVRGATKAFGGAIALRGVDLEIVQGEIHALLGENGAGKSTLIKLLAAVHSPDDGAFEVAGAPLPQSFGAADIAGAGVRFVHQDFGLIDTMSVTENMALVGGFERRNGLIDHRASSRRAADQLARLGMRIDPSRLVGDLPEAERAILALARALEGDARLIVVDEVTAALPSPDVARVHEAIRAARARGVAFIYVSHRLEEVFQLCDRLTVLRDGRNIATADVGSVDMARVVEWIAGRRVALKRPAAPSAHGRVRLVARALRGGVVEQPIDFAVAAGEVLGITGIIGSGYDAICAMTAGIDAPASGRVEIDGRVIAPGSTADSRAAGLEVVLGERSRAAFAERTVRENLFADAIYGPAGWPDLAGELRRTDELVGNFGVRPRNCAEATIQSLSGGNQQKVLFARALMADPKALVLVDPTAGVDVGARAELHDVMRGAVARGAAVLFGSSDFEEIMAVADRVLVVRDGRIASTLEGEDATWDRLFLEAHGGAAHTAPAARGPTP